MAVATGTAEVVVDPDRPGARLLLLDGAAQSEVDLDDPTWLGFEYVRRIGHVVDLCAPAGQRLDAVHLGGGGLTLPRYVAATRPGSRQRVFEHDALLADLVRREMPLPRGWAVRVGTVDAREGLASLREASADLVVSDAFAGARTPAHLAGRGLVAEAARVLRPGGTYAVNVADGPPLRHARAQVATVASVLPHVLVVAEPGVLRGRRFGNLVVVASDQRLPVEDLVRRAAGDPVAARVVEGGALTAFVAGARPGADADPVASPPPPDDARRV